MAKYLDDHAIAAKQMDWCNLAGVIIDMEQELYELWPFYKPKEREKLAKVIHVYEREKAFRVAELSQGTDYAKFIFDEY